MKKFIFILGGARSGKSTYAVELAKRISKKVIFIATAAPSDKEMKKRVKLHKRSRPKHWDLIEEEKDVSTVLDKFKNKYKVILIDCLGLFVSNLFMDNLKDKEIEKRVQKLVKIILKTNVTVILVSNEVGSGIVPNNALTRRFRDIVGRANQVMAKYADEVIFMQAGIAIKIK
jgi:adenosylcobinamide kinase/adenosylcobinamide-phosphate guanylyltransferase